MILDLSLDSSTLDRIQDAFFDRNLFIQKMKKIKPTNQVLALLHK